MSAKTEIDIRRAEAVVDAERTETGPLAPLMDRLTGGTATPGRPGRRIVLPEEAVCGSCHLALHRRLVDRKTGLCPECR